MTTEGNPPDQDSEAKRSELHSMSQQERIARAGELAAQMRAQTRAEGAAPAAPRASTAAPAQETPAAPQGGVAPVSITRPAVRAQRPAAAREERLVEPPMVAPAPGSVFDIFQRVLPGVEMTAAQMHQDVNIYVKREYLLRVMQAAKEDAMLAFDFLRSISGVDQMERGLEVVYHLYSFKHGHSVAIRTIAPEDDARVPSMTGLWAGANWHERELTELFGIECDGHPDPRPLLTEEGLGYYILRRNHPLADIEEWQEDLLAEVSQEEAERA
jgi:NADH-quinone oxidoreductase subunit C